MHGLEIDEESARFDGGVGLVPTARDESIDALLQVKPDLVVDFRADIAMATK